MNIPQLQWRIILLTSLGGALELYDFVIFAFLAPVLGALFFPSKDPLTSILHVFIVFAIGYLARPIGGLLCGHLGDRYGRKKTLILTVMTMAVPTFLIGLLPTYAHIGVFATLLLCLLRIIQGLGIAGEVPGAIVFVTESLHTRQGLATGIIFFGLNVGILTGALISTILTITLPEASLMSWGWRLPFLMGGLLGVVCYYLRKQIQETPLFQALILENKRSHRPLLEVLQHHSKAILQGFCLSAFGSAFFSLYFYMPTYFTLLMNYPKNNIMIINTVSICIFACFALFFAMLSDYIPRRIIISIGCLLFLSMSVPIYYLFQGDINYTRIIVGELIISTMAGLITGIFPYLLTEIFPTSIRYSGYALTYNLAFAIIGGLTPSILTFWIGHSHHLMAPAYYLMLLAGICLIAVFSMKTFHLSKEMLFLGKQE